MNTTLHFYLNDNTETQITTIRDYQGAPMFKKGDKFWFSISMLYPITKDNLLKEYKKEFVDSIIDDNEKMIENFNNTKFKIVSVFTELKYNRNLDETHRLEIEYRCKKLKYFYWKFWISYKFRKFWKLFKIS